MPINNAVMEHLADLADPVIDIDLGVHVQPVKTDITLPLALPSHRQEREKGLLRRAEQLHERQ